MKPNSLFTEREIEAADSLLLLLLQIPVIFPENPPGLPTFKWGKTRRRSALDSPPSSPPPPSKEKEIAASPATPLSFSPSESEDKAKRSSRKNVKKRKREDLLEMIDGLTKRRDLLRGEVETVRNYCKKLKAENLELKALKQERLLSVCHGSEDANLDDTSKNLNLGLNIGNHYQIALQNQHKHEQQLPLIVGQGSLGSERVENLHYPIGQLTPLPLLKGLGMVSQVGPHGIPDLNLSAEEANICMDSPQPFILNRAPLVLDNSRAILAAEARKRRRMKMKETKNSFVPSIKPLRR